MKMSVRNARRAMKVILAINICITLTKMFPAFVLWLLCLGAIKVDYREDYLNDIIALPGWTKNELTWFVTARWCLQAEFKQVST